MAPTIVTRSQWGARHPRGVVSTTGWSSRVGVAVHHSAGPTSQTVRQIQDHQMDNNGWFDIGYNWLVTQDGRLWEGRLHTWTAIGAHAGGQNTAWIGVCWIGHSGNTAPSAAALATIRWVVDEARRRAGRRLDVRGHGQVPGQATECPGSRLRAWISAGLPTQEDDVDLSDKVDLTDGDGNRWSFGDLMKRDDISVKGALGAAAGSYYAWLWHVRPALATLTKLAEQTLAAASGLTEEQVSAAVAAGVREAVDPEELAELIASRVDRDLDRVAVAAALREVLGSVDES